MLPHCVQTDANVRKFPFLEFSPSWQIPIRRVRLKRRVYSVQRGRESRIAYFARLGLAFPPDVLRATVTRMTALIGFPASASRNIPIICSCQGARIYGKLSSKLLLRQSSSLSIIYEPLGKVGAFGERVVFQKLRYLGRVGDRRGATTVLPIGDGILIASDDFGHVLLSEA